MNGTAEHIGNFIGTNRNFILLWQGMAVSKFGTYLFEIALIIWLQAQTDSAGLIAAVLVASLVPSILLSPFGGVIADRFPKNKVLVISDLISGFLVTALGITLFLNLLPFSYGYVMIILVSICLGLTSSAFNPASMAVIPELVMDSKLQKANSVYQSTSKASELAGQGLGGILTLALGAPILFIVNGISFLASAISELFIKLSPSENDKKNKSGSGWDNIKKDILEGFTYGVNNNNVKSIFYVIAIYHFFISPLPVLLPFYISETLNLNSFWLGILLAVFSAGTISGLSFAGSDRGKISDEKVHFFLMLSTSVVFIILGLVPLIISVLLSLLVLGFIIGIIVVNLYTFLQQLAPKSIQGRLFGLLNTITNASFPLGIAIYGFAIDLLRNTYSHTGFTSKIIFSFNGLCLLLFSLGLYRKLRFNRTLKAAPEQQ